jgi:alpha-galactosidase
MTLGMQIVRWGVLLGWWLCGAALAEESTPILTPPPPAEPRINGANVFGVRSGSPLLYTIPATGQRPMQFAADGLPDGLKLDSATGQITGVSKEMGEYMVVLRASNDKGVAQKSLRIVVGDRIALTPPMGWNSWNCWAGAVDQEKVLRSAKAMVSSGLINHGWTYINIDDTWQGQRGGPLNALQANEKFPDMKGLCDQIHAMGLKTGIYSTPWISSFALNAGGSSDDPSGAWSKELAHGKYNRHGKYSFAAADAKQWGQWGIDYLKYDWAGNDVKHAKEMSEALRRSGRDIVFSLSPSTSFELASEWTKLANSWRTTGDIWDYWKKSDASWRYGVSEIAYNQDRWKPYAGPGHWNDADMLVLGQVGWGPNLHPTNLTPDEQYTHISMWCMLSSPLLLGCDLERLDPFTLNLLSNDEVLALNQDALGKQATRVATVDAVDVYAKELEDGSKAVGFFNRARQPENLNFNKIGKAGVHGKHHVRDLWRQKDLEDVDENVDQEIKMTISAHGVVLLKFTPVAKKK